VPITDPTVSRTDAPTATCALSGVTTIGGGVEPFSGACGVGEAEPELCGAPDGAAVAPGDGSALAGEGLAVGTAAGAGGGGVCDRTGDWAKDTVSANAATNTAARGKADFCGFEGSVTGSVSMLPRLLPLPAGPLAEFLTQASLPGGGRRTLEASCSRSSGKAP
jgi:hypothetical protein